MGIEKTEEQWEAYCNWLGCAHIPLWEIRKKYADLPLALREYCYLMGLKE